MNRFAVSTMAASAIFLVATPPRVEAQSAADLAGTWTLVSAIVEQGGARADTFGPNPQGTLVFSPDGRYALVFVRRALPKFASNNRAQGTPEENKAVVQSSIAHFGTYAVEEGGKTLVFRIEASTFPNWTGAEQRRALSLSGDELTYTVPAASAGGTAQIMLRRAR